ncbi:MAG: hypothetical protein OIN86_17080 [Candidatus Methanoperedens sp.]|nr:hypothetical protein [Candidatus Methanoperedens sp.]
MEIIEIKCENCERKIYVEKDCAREKMFCTLKCMDSYPNKTKYELE